MGGEGFFVKIVITPLGFEGKHRKVKS